MTAVDDAKELLMAEAVQIHGGSLVWHVFMEASDG